MRKTPAYLSYSEKKKVEVTLGQFLRKSTDDPTKCFYPDGQTDEDMVIHIRTFIPHITKNHIRDMRKECFGELYHIKGGNRGSPTKRIEALEARVARLESKLAEELGFTLNTLGE